MQWQWQSTFSFRITGVYASLMHGDSQYVLLVNGDFQLFARWPKIRIEMPMAMSLRIWHLAANLLPMHLHWERGSMSRPSIMEIWEWRTRGTKTLGKGPEASEYPALNIIEFPILQYVMVPSEQSTFLNWPQLIYMIICVARFGSIKE